MWAEEAARQGGHRAQRPGEAEATEHAATGGRGAAEHSGQEKGEPWSREVAPGASAGRGRPGRDLRERGQAEVRVGWAAWEEDSGLPDQKRTWGHGGRGSR